MLEDLLSKKIIFVGGKGGVGKTTTAASLAYQLSQKGQKTLIISTDPAHSLGDALDQKLSHEIQEITENLYALELDLEKLTEAHFEKISKTIALYTKPELQSRVNRQLELAKDAPGGQEAALLETLCQYLVEFETLGFDKLIFDTAPTGHTLRLLILPEMMSAWTEGLILQQKKQKERQAAAMKFWEKAENQTNNPFNEERQSPWQQALTQLEARKKLFKQARDIIHDPKLSAIVLIMLAEKLPLFETLRTLEQFKKMDIRCSGVIVNQIIHSKLCEHAFWQKRYQLQQELLDNIQASVSVPLYQALLQPEEIIGLKKLQKFSVSALAT